MVPVLGIDLDQLFPAASHEGGAAKPQAGDKELDRKKGFAELAEARRAKQKAEAAAGRADKETARLEELLAKAKDAQKLAREQADLQETRLAAVVQRLGDAFGEEEASQEAPEAAAQRRDRAVEEDLVFEDDDEEATQLQEQIRALRGQLRTRALARGGKKHKTGEKEDEPMAPGDEEADKKLKEAKELQQEAEKARKAAKALAEAKAREVKKATEEATLAAEQAATAKQAAEEAKSKKPTGKAAAASSTARG